MPFTAAITGFIKSKRDAKPPKPGGKRLLACLGDATQDHVLHDFGIDTGPIDEGVQDLGCHVGRVPSGKLPFALAAGGPQRCDDKGLGHALNTCEVR
jgi:hypothetical protein